MVDPHPPRAAWALLKPHAAGRRVVLFGRSLGTGLAAGLAAELQPDLTVLVSPYASLRALAREHFPWVPAAILRYPLATDALLPRLRTPVLLMHGIGGGRTLWDETGSDTLQAIAGLGCRAVALDLPAKPPRRRRRHELTRRSRKAARAARYGSAKVEGAADAAQAEAIGSEADAPETVPGPLTERLAAAAKQHGVVFVRRSWWPSPARAAASARRATAATWPRRPRILSITSSRRCPCGSG